MGAVAGDVTVNALGGRGTIHDFCAAGGRSAVWCGTSCGRDDSDER